MAEKKEKLVDESPIIDFDEISSKVSCYDPIQDKNSSENYYADAPKHWEHLRAHPSMLKLENDEILQLIRKLSPRLGVVLGPQERPEPLAHDESVTYKHIEILISDKYELARPLPVRFTDEDDGSVIITSVDLNLYAEGCTEYEARSNFSEILTEQLEDLEALTREGKKLGRDLRIQLSILRRILKSL